MTHWRCTVLALAVVVAHCRCDDSRCGDFLLMCWLPLRWWLPFDVVTSFWCADSLLRWWLPFDLVTPLDIFYHCRFIGSSRYIGSLEMWWLTGDVSLLYIDAFDHWRYGGSWRSGGWRYNGVRYGGSLELWWLIRDMVTLWSYGARLIGGVEGSQKIMLM